MYRLICPIIVSYFHRKASLIAPILTDGIVNENDGDKLNIYRYAKYTETKTFTWFFHQLFFKNKSFYFGSFLVSFLETRWLKFSCFRTSGLADSCRIVKGKEPLIFFRHFLIYWNKFFFFGLANAGPSRNELLEQWFPNFLKKFPLRTSCNFFNDLRPIVSSIYCLFCNHSIN